MATCRQLRGKLHTFQCFPEVKFNLVILIIIVCIIDFFSLFSPSFFSVTGRRNLGYWHLAYGTWHSLLERDLPLSTSRHLKHLFFFKSFPRRPILGRALADQLTQLTRLCKSTASSALRINSVKCSQTADLRKRKPKNCSKTARSRLCYFVIRL